MLVATPRLVPTESFLGYVLRLTEANGYPTTAYILSAIHGEWYRSAHGRLDGAPLSELAGLSFEEVERLNMRPQEKPRAYIRIRGNDLPSYEVSLTRPKVCPECLKEEGVCEAFWDLAQAVACPKHSLMLVKECHGCGRALSWARSKVSQCACGADLTAAPAEPAPGVLADLMGAVRHFVYGDQAVAQLPSALAHLEHLDLRSLCKLMWVISSTLRQRHSQRGRSLPKSRSKFLQGLPAVAAALTDWPLGFRSFLSETYGPELDASREQPRFKKMFAWTFHRLAKNDTENSLRYRFIEKEIYRFGAAYWTRGAMGISEEWFQEIHVRWGTLDEAVRLTGLHNTTLRAMIKRGEVPTKTISDSSLRGLVIDLDWARAKPVSRFAPVPVRSAAKLVGVSIETLREMRRLGIYEAKHLCSPKVSYAAEDLDALCRRFSALSQGKKEKKFGVALVSECFSRYDASPTEKAAFFGMLLDNPEMVVGCKGRSPSQGFLQVSSHTVFERWRYGTSETGYVTAQAAMKRLNCSADVITGLKRGGHLVLGRSRGREAICSDSLSQFEATYETVATIAGRMGACVRSIYHRLNFSNLRHLRVVGNQHTTVFVHRADAPLAQRMIQSLECFPR